MSNQEPQNQEKTTEEAAWKKDVGLLRAQGLPHRLF